MTEEVNTFHEMNSHLHKFIEELSSIPWFENIGKPVLNYKVKQVFSIKEAWTHLQDESWSNASFHSHIDSMHPIWDLVYDKVLQLASQSPSCLELEEGISIADATAYDVASAAVEVATESEDTFFINLMYWYKLGHWPCGWKGEYPKGELIIY